MTDENAKRLKQAAKSLRSAGLTGYHLEREIDELAWFVGGDPAKIMQLQHKLNQLNISGKSGRLKEDGVYGQETWSALAAFMSNLEHGVVPALTWIDPLQGTDIAFAIGDSSKGFNNVIKNADSGFQYFRTDAPHMKGTGYFRGTQVKTNYNHINVEFGQNATALQSWVKQKYNHYPLSDTAYAAVKDLKQLGKVVRIGGKVLLVGGVVLDTLELATAVEADLKDVDKKLGHQTVSAAASIGGRWIGAGAGAKLGALAGAATGPFAPIAVPVLAIVGGLAGSFAGDAIAQWIVDITDAEE